MIARVLPILVALGFLIAGSTLGAQNQPLPNQESFLLETRKHLQADSTLQGSYVYVETRRALKLDKGGRTREESVKVVESYPGLPGEERWERLIAEDGRPVPPEELARQDRERQQKANEMVQRLARNSSKELARQERELQKARRERDEAVSDIYDVFEIRMIGRERVEEHDTIAFLLTPRRDAKPKTRAGEQMRHFSVRAWVSEHDHELVKLEAEAIDNLRLGLGGLAKLHKGARLSFLRRKVNGEVWLPAVVSYNGSARVGLLFTSPAQRNVRVFRLSQVLGRYIRGFQQAEVANRARIVPMSSRRDAGSTMSDQTDVLQGTLDLLIMRTIALEPLHGWAIAQRIQQISDDLLRVRQGSLYPALHRLEHQGWITADWGASENNRRARFYALTKAGRKQLEAEVAKWERLSAGVNLVLQRT